jgi:hypothetical protein
MANTNFTGPVRSENGFEVISKNATSGTVTTSLDIASDGAIDLTYSSADTGTANVEPIVMENTMTGAGGLAGRARFQLNANAALGSYSNALKAISVYGASGKTTGLGSAFVAEMTMSAGTDAGTYAPLEIELNVPDSASLGTATSFMYASVNGADKTTFDDSGYIMDIAGVTAGTNKAFANNGSIDDVDEITNGLKVRIAGADYYILLATAANFAD